MTEFLDDDTLDEVGEKPDLADDTLDHGGSHAGGAFPPTARRISTATTGTGIGAGTTGTGKRKWNSSIGGIGSAVTDHNFSKRSRLDESSPGASSSSFAGGGAGPSSAGAAVDPSFGGAAAGPSSSRQTKYSIGQHGAKGDEQQRLTGAYGIPISGGTHESEHPIGFEPLNRTSGLKRGTSGRAKDIENFAPAYQEQKGFHKSHIGTATKGKADSKTDYEGKTYVSAFKSSQDYRNAQRTAIEEDENPSTAVQLNQLEYAHNPAFQNADNTPERQAADDSYNTMVENMTQVTFAQNTQDINIPVHPEDQAEMFLARQAARTGKWPTIREINTVRSRLGLAPQYVDYEEEDLMAQDEQADYGQEELMAQDQQADYGQED